MANCTELKTLDLSNNSLAALPSTLPSNLTHLYVNANPLAINVSALSESLQGTKLAALDVQFLNVQLIWNYSNDGEGCLGICYGPRVAAPRICALGPKAPPCQWTIHLYDAWDQPCHVGGMALDLSLGLGCHDGFDSCMYRADMVDQRDGTFLATVGAGWIPKQGSYDFRFFRQGVEFEPYRAPGNTYFGYHTLRTIEFTPRTDCPQHAEPDVTGLHCSCKTGYEAERTIGNSTLACRRRCENDHVPGSNGNCTCPSRSYDPFVVGVLHCAASEWSEPDPAPVSPRCDPCPECATCEDGRTELKSGWRFADGDFHTAFRCPYAEIKDANATCPSMALPVIVQPSCLGNHTDELCANCLPEMWVSGGLCKPCDAGATADRRSPLAILFIVCGLLAVTGLSIRLLKSQKSRVLRMKADAFTNVKIVLGLAQVLTLLRDVLNIVFPPAPAAALSYMGLLTVDVKSLMQFRCHGITWYGKWAITVLAVPLLGFAAVTFRWGWARMRKKTLRAQIDAKATAIAGAFFWTMLIHPRVSTALLAALRCRRLGPTYSVLEADYGIDCNSGTYLSVKVTTIFLLLVWTIGVPLGLLVLLWRRSKKARLMWQQRTCVDATLGRTRTDESRGSSTHILLDRIPQADDTTAPGSANSLEPLGDSNTHGTDDDVTADEFHRAQLQLTYAFCTDSYRHACWWFEPIDMMRKLLLSALLQFIERGSALQVLVGCGLSVGSISLQLVVLPYRDVESNILKALVDVQLFLTFLISFILRVLPSVHSESVGAATYGWVLVVSLGLVLGMAVGLTIHLVRRRRRFSNDLTAMLSNDFEGGANDLSSAASHGLQRVEATAPRQDSNPVNSTKRNQMALDNLRHFAD
jgi:hypothetical protein